MRANGKTYTGADFSLVTDWADRWFELAILIVDVTGTDEPPSSPPPPNDIEEIRYQRLRFWLREHEERFLGLWKDYFAYFLKEHQEELTEGDVPGPGEDGRYFEKPFLEFYEADNLYRLAQQLGLQSGADLWEPSEPRVQEMRENQAILSHSVLGLVDWLEERSGD